MSKRVVERGIYRLKPHVPSHLWGWLTSPYWWWYNRARHRMAAALSRRFQRDQARLARMKDVHRGERCFIIGNGPSLNEMDLSPLADEITFGMNRIYLLFDEVGFATTYFVSVNTLVIEQCAGEIRRLTMPKFITWRGRRWLADDPGAVFVDTDYTAPPAFSTRATGRMFEGSTVTYVALQLAYHMGFDEVVLIGVDHSFKTEGPPNVTVESQGADQDHFAAGYFGKGFRWQLPDLEASEAAYRMAKRAFEADGRRVLDATVGGKLEIFPKVDYTSIVRASGRSTVGKSSG
jgi:hypothetical protein